MKQMTLAAGVDRSAGFEKYRKPTRRDAFLGEMQTLVPWAELVELIEPHYPKAGNGRPPIWSRSCARCRSCRPGRACPRRARSRLLEATRRSGCGRHLVKLATLHDRAHPRLVLQYADVDQWVCLDQQEISEVACADLSHLHTHQFATEARRRNERVGGRETEERDEEFEVACIAADRVIREAIVAARQDPDSSLVQP